MWLSIRKKTWKLSLTCTILLGLSTSTAALPAVAPDKIKAIFLFKDVMQSNTTALKTFFDAVLAFRIGVLANGDLVYYSTGGQAEAVDAPVVTGGSYVGGSALADKVKSFKEGSTSISRVEISLVSNDQTFQNIRSLISTNGEGEDNPLYISFDTLRKAWNLDGFNNDDESVYEVSSTVSFAKMLGAMGYKYSAAPYTNTNFWVTVKSQINDAVPDLFDRVYLQCYDGGAGNDPGAWQTALDMKVIPIVWVTNDAKPSQGNTPAQAEVKFANWNSQYSVAGGGYWNDYDIEKMDSSYDSYGGVLANVFQ